MPVPIRDATTLARVHMNAHIALLTEAALPLALEPDTVAALGALAANNGREIVAALAADAAFMRSLADGLRDSAEASADDPPLAPPPPPGPVATAGAAALAAAAAAGGGAAPGAAAGRERALQVWGLLRELCTLAQPLHPIERAAFYRAADAAGVLAAFRAALRRPSLPEALAAVHVRCLDCVLLCLNHDPSLLRRAALDVTSAAEAAETVPARLVALLADGGEMGTLTQASEALRILLDPGSMEPAEQNAFLDAAYERGHFDALLTALAATADGLRDAGDGGGAASAAEEAAGGCSSAGARVCSRCYRRASASTATARSGGWAAARCGARSSPFSASRGARCARRRCASSACC